MGARETEKGAGKIMTETQGNKRMDGRDKAPVTAIKP
jgi:hypothetical protein